MKVYLETFGCQMNRLDSELVIGHLQTAGHEMAATAKAADVVLYNTCSVRRHAEEKVFSRLGAEARRKACRTGPLIIGVLGCMAQGQGAALRRRCPDVDIVCAPGRLHELPALIEAAAQGRPAVALDPDRTAGTQGDDADFDALDVGRDVSNAPRPTQAYVRVMRGCDKFCTYCIVPWVRGRESSRRPQRIVEEVRRLVDAGHSEITLLGQTVNSYRTGSGGQEVGFSGLLERVSAVGGLRRLRFVTSHPLDFGTDILEAMRDLPNICEYVHLPAQSGADPVLVRMNRRYTRAQYDSLVDRARDIVPGVVLAGDFIVGFPGETEADHQASADLIRRSGYKNSFVFKYSPRPRTFAAKKLADDVDDATKRRRNNELLAVQAEVGLAHHRHYIGEMVEVLVEGPSRRVDKQAAAPSAESMQLAGRTRGDHIVVFDGPETLAGGYVDVRIVDATALTLFGQPATPQPTTDPPHRTAALP